MRVALESTVITHGLPYPQNIESALRFEEIVREQNCEPATIGVLAGEIRVGMTEKEIRQLAGEAEVLKAGVRELPVVVARKLNVSTTVSATSRIAALNGIDVFATGGIGGVHPGDWDVSQDLFEMTRSSLVVVCAGPKAILDLNGTQELLESLGVTVVGYKTDEMPAFYSRSCGYKIMPVESAEEIAQSLLISREMKIKGTILVFNPIPAENEIPNAQIEEWTKLSNADLHAANITGKAVTPFLLSRMAHHSDGRTIVSNRALLENNVLLACQIAKALEGLK